ncbi:DUF501 domain-containing protein [uncultured Amnibacterium sp.]|uniref:DUF501 domain-containing protein n=1 Tax=uncultured Amnibacterium sp. TaxID=1631851 RepID=UPI0035CA2BFA
MSPPSAADLATVAAQLGRTARDVLAIAARTADGQPAVVATAPRLADGTPFPTFYYLTHPLLVRAMSQLEAAGRMHDYTAQVAADDALAAQYLAAHRAYLADRDAVAVVPQLAGTSAGGMPGRVKCLHALAAHALASGRGVNPIGDRALTEAAVADQGVATAIPSWAPAPSPDRATPPV